MASRPAETPAAPSEREAMLIQCVGEMGRGLAILDKELRRGQFNDARLSVAMLLTVVQTADALIAGTE
jgi:hypothetical protein